jgi:hypothetical protein
MPDFISWPRYLPQSARAPYAGGSLDSLHSFQPDAGPPIDRPRFSGSLRQYGFELPPVTPEIASRFNDWVDGDLLHRSRPFLFHDFMDRGVLWSWKMSEPPRTSVVLDEFVQISFPALRLPSRVWFAEYVPDDLAEVPAVIADWVNGVFAINGERVGASELSAVSGYFEARDGASIDPGYYVAPGSLGVIPPEGVTRLVLFNGPTVTHNGEVVTVNGEPLEVY